MRLLNDAAFSHWKRIKSFRWTVRFDGRRVCMYVQLGVDDAHVDIDNSLHAKACVELELEFYRQYVAFSASFESIVDI